MNHAQGGITGYEMQAVDEEIGQRLGQGREDAYQTLGYLLDAS